jgi:hypothetical protein
MHPGSLVVEVEGRCDLNILFIETKKCEEVIKKANYFMKVAR